MPIDLKWVRNHAAQVEDWQRQRGLPVEHVARTAQLDIACRQELHRIRQLREEINRLTKGLRHAVDRELILQERTSRQAELRDAEESWKAQEELLKSSLWQLASPLDTQISENYPVYHNQDETFNKLPLDLERHAGALFQSGLHQAAQICFQGKYSLCSSLPDLAAGTEREWLRKHTDLLHAMWGYSKDQLSTSSPDAADPPSTIPAWLVFLAQSMPKKTIFGAKQLGQFTLLRSGHHQGLELGAVTPGTTWDSRQVQVSLAQELQAFYQSILINTTVELLSETKDLHLHEQSRLLVVARDKILAWVSNYGDAAARACDFIFKGGGRHDVKEHVHLVHATVVVDQVTAHHVLQCNRSVDEKSHQDGTVLIPPLLQQTTGWGGKVSLQLFQATKKALAMCQSSASLSLNVQSTKCKFELLFNGASVSRKEWKAAETLSCPFGFLIQ